MAAYFIAQYVVNDPKLYREYQAAAGPTILAAGGEVVAFDVAGGAEGFRAAASGHRCRLGPGQGGRCSGRRR